MSAPDHAEFESAWDRWPLRGGSWGFELGSPASQRGGERCPGTPSNWGQSLVASSLGQWAQGPPSPLRSAGAGGMQGALQGRPDLGVLGAAEAAEAISGNLVPITVRLHLGFTAARV